MDSGGDAKHDLQGTTLRARCQECDRENEHTIVASAEFYDDYRVDAQFSIQSWDEYQVVECNGCQTRSFRHSHRDTENTDHDRETGEEFLVNTVHVYPELEVARRPIHGSHLLPSQLTAIYEETLAALNRDLRVLAGVGIRALIETICRDRGAVGRTLESKIDTLVTQGVVAAAGAEILHGLRIMGNEAAHEVMPHVPADLHIAMTVVEHALQGIYILPAQAAGLPRRGTMTAAEDESDPPVD